MAGTITIRVNDNEEEWLNKVLATTKPLYELTDE